MATILVTGGAGNIGSFIVDQLVEMDHFVVVVDNFYNGKIQNIQHRLDRGKATLEVCDITNYRHLKRVFEEWKAEYVSHAPARPKGWREALHMCCRLNDVCQ